MWVIQVKNVNMAGCYSYRCFIKIKWVLDLRTYDSKYSCQSQTHVVNVSLMWNLKTVWPFVTPEGNAHEERPSHTHAENKCTFCDISVSFTHMNVCVEFYSSLLAEWNQHFASIFGCFSLWRALFSSAHPSLISPDGFPCCSSFHWENVMRFCLSVEKKIYNYYFSSVRWFRVIFLHLITGIFLVILNFICKVWHNFICSELYTKMTWI